MNDILFLGDIMAKYQNYISNKKEYLIDSLLNFKKDISRKKIKQYISNGVIFVNDKIITKANFLVNINDKITINYNKTITNQEINILYEDEYLIAINKPAGLLSISNDKEKYNTAYRMTSDYVKNNSKNNYIFVIHRLDQDTSGIIMFAKNEKVRDILQDNWNNLVKKRGYIAICDGIITGNGTIHTFLKENKNQFVYSSNNSQGKYAITHYHVIKNNNNYSLVQVYIDTGRRNQIRVHLSEKGYPIVGDKKYGCITNPIKRLCLHANILEFIHPVSKKLIHIECNYPQQFNKVIKNIK